MSCQVVQEVDFFELEKGDTLPKYIHRSKPEFSEDDSVIILFSTESDNNQLKYFHYQTDIYRDNENYCGITGKYIHNDIRIEVANNPETLYGNNVYDICTGVHYYRVRVDLNEKAGGYYLYLCYRRTDDKYSSFCNLETSDKRFTWRNDFRLKMGLKMHVRSGDYNEEVDLNMGAGGDYIYLTAYKILSDVLYNQVVRTDPFYENRPITELIICSTSMKKSKFKNYMLDNYPGWQIVSNEHSNKASRLPKDLNDGAGGSYVYILYKN